jgi:hypothetical protein
VAHAEAGKLRLEGKEYVVREGDVMHFRFNVSYDFPAPPNRPHLPPPAQRRVCRKASEFHALDSAVTAISKIQPDVPRRLRRALSE